MPAFARLLGPLLLAVLVTSEVSFAQSNAETATKWGLLGSWKVDCNAPTNRQDPTVAYAVREGRLFHDRDFGDAKDSSPVVLATRKPDGAIELVVTFTSLKQTRQYSLTKGSDGRARALSNRNVDTNDYSVRNGKFTANGNETPWQARCR
jgi:hypothetical protein